MATRKTTRKPTAAQLAARERFAAMARSGALARKRKTAAKNPARKKPRSRKQDLAIAMAEKRAGHPRKAREFFERAARAKNPRKAKPTLGGTHEYQVQYRPTENHDWEIWSTYLYREMAEDVAHRIFEDKAVWRGKAPGQVRVISFPRPKR